MGCVLSVRSPVEKTGKTVLTYLLAHKFTQQVNSSLRVLICCANAKNGTLRSLFRSTPPVVEMEDLVNIGIVSHGERLNLYGMLDCHDSIYFIGSLRSGPAFTSRYSDAYRSLVHEFKGLFDLVIVDIPTGNDLLGKIFLEESDGFVNVLPQDAELLKDHVFKTRKDIAYIINKFRNDLPGVEELSEIYGVDRLTVLPYCNRLAEFHKNGRLDIYSRYVTEFNKALSIVAGELGRGLGFIKETGKQSAGKSDKALAVLLEEMA